MDENAAPSDPLRLAHEVALAEERSLWRAIHDPGLKAANRVVAYARWRAAVERLTTPLRPGATE